MAGNAMQMRITAEYSLDLAPSDFCLFGQMKGLFGRESFETGKRLLSVVEGLLQSLEKRILIKAFLE
jgi:hypothetical protein